MCGGSLKRPLPFLGTLLHDNKVIDSSMYRSAIVFLVVIVVAVFGLYFVLGLCMRAK